MSTTEVTTGEDRLRAAHDQLTQAVEQLVSGEDWAQMLNVAARFHRYSLNNVLLIQLQMPEATRVAGYRSWQTLGHQVRRGEHGLTILAPVLRRVQAEETSTSPPQPTPISDGVERKPRQQLVGFKLTKVFDPLSQVSSIWPGQRPCYLTNSRSCT